MFILIPACTNECTRVCLYLGIYRPGLWPCYSDFSRWGLAQNITNSDQRVPILVWCCMCPKGSGKETWLQCTCIYVKSVYKDVYIYIHLRIPVSNQPTSLYLTHIQDEMIPPSHSRMLHARAEKSRWLWIFHWVVWFAGWVRGAPLGN